MSSVRDVLVITVILFAIGIAVIFVTNMSHRINVNLLAVNTINDSVKARTVINSADKAVYMSDYIYFALFIALFFGIILTGWYVGGEPIIAPIYFVIVTIFTFVAVILQLVWIELSSSANVLSMTANLPLTTFILSNLGYFTAIFGLVGIVIMFAKPSQQ